MNGFLDHADYPVQLSGLHMCFVSSRFPLERLDWVRVEWGFAGINSFQIVHRC